MRLLPSKKCHTNYGSIHHIQKMEATYIHRWFSDEKPHWWPLLSRLTTLITIALMFWAIAYSLFGESAGLDSQGFRLAVLFITGKAFGAILDLMKIPPMLGQLAMGVLLRNVGFISLSGDYVRFAAILRQLALVNILLPAGLGLDPIALKKSLGNIVLLALVPPLVEVVVVAVIGYFLMELSWLWGFLLGFLLSAVSPAVVIPCLFELQERGLGTDKGIHTIVIAASTLNDISCIAAFGVILGIIFSTGSLAMQIAEGPIVVVIGLGYGILLGFVAHQFPDRKDSYVVALRTIFIGAGSVVASVGSSAIGYGGAGTLGCITGAFVASFGWRRMGWTGRNPVKENFSLLWKFFEPISFGLIGMEVKLELLRGEIVGWGFLALTLGLFFRLMFSTFITIPKRSGFNIKETIFIAACWIPKATVQAALGPAALDLARSIGDQEKLDLATTVLITAVLSIVVTSPIGALLIMQGGPRWLKKSSLTNNIDVGHENPVIEEDSKL